MFRDNVGQLAHDLAGFIHEVVYGGGYLVKGYQGDEYVISVDPKRGSPADVALLFSSPQEFDYNQKPKLPFLLRERLKNMEPPVQVFNPRGRNLETIPDVQILCGLMLECVDPDIKVQDSANLPSSGANMINAWRRRAKKHISKNPPPNTGRTLKEFVNAWKNRIPLDNNKWEEEIALIDLFYKLVTWVPSLQNDIEGLVYLEAIARTINRVGLFGRYLGRIIFDENNLRLEQSSIKEALWSIFVPIATGSIEINEDLFETLPPNRVNIMSIHQAKGLEFPLVIVDVGSDLRDLRSPAFKRFPKNGGKTCKMENEMRPYSPLGPPTRSALNRAFDDLIRLYFEAYSRAQDVLMLVGLNSVRNGYSVARGKEQRRIEHVATGWDRNRTWHWGEGLNNLVHI